MTTQNRYDTGLNYVVADQPPAPIDQTSLIRRNDVMQAVGGVIEAYRVQQSALLDSVTGETVQGRGFLSDAGHVRHREAVQPPVLCRADDQVNHAEDVHGSPPLPLDGDQVLFRQRQGAHHLDERRAGTIHDAGHGAGQRDGGLAGLGHGGDEQVAGRHHPGFGNGLFCAVNGGHGLHASVVRQ